MYPSPLLHELHQYNLAVALRQAEQARLLRAARAEALSISQQQPTHQMKRSWWLKSRAVLKQIGAPFTTRGVSACRPERLSCACS